MAAGDAVDIVLTRVEGARRRLGQLSGDRAPAAARSACELGRALSQEIAHLLADLAGESPAMRATSRAAGERFDSHVLAATLLEASDGSPSSVFELVGRGLIRLTADLERVRTRRLPA